MREADEGKAQFDAGTVFHDKPQQIHRSENSGPVKLLVVGVSRRDFQKPYPLGSRGYMSRPNPALNRSAQRRCRWVPVARCAPAPG